MLAQLCRTTAIDSKVNTISQIVGIDGVTKAGLKLLCNNIADVPDLEFANFLTFLQKYSSTDINLFFNHFTGNETNVALVALVKEPSLLATWKQQKDIFKANGYVSSKGMIYPTCQSIMTNNSDPYLNTLLTSVMALAKPSATQVVLVGVTHPSLKGKVFTNGNFRTSEAAAEKTFLETGCHPLLRSRINYMGIILKAIKDATNIINPTLAAKFLTIDDIDPLTKAGRPGYHGEVRSLSEALYELEAISQKPITSYNIFSEFSMFIRNTSDKVMPRCPCCFYITNGVKIIGGN
jgi:hypothetical protein